MRRIACAFVMLCLSVGSVHGQEVPAAEATEAQWSALRDIRLANREERRNEGWALTIWGALSAAGGVVMAVAGRDDSFWLSAGLTTISFAAFNIPLGIGLLDLRGSRLGDIHNSRAGELTSYEDVLDAALSAQTAKRASLAVNAALDVLYVLAGALIVGLADRTKSENTARGSGWAMVSQGGVLLALDLYGVIATSRRVRELRAL